MQIIWMLGVTLDNLDMLRTKQCLDVVNKQNKSN